MKMPQTPSSERATTRNPETAPPRIATCTASTRLRRAAEAVRTFDLTATNMPMIPEAIEHAAPTRNANAVMTPDRQRRPWTGTSATAGVSTSVMTTPMITAREDRDDPDRRVLAADERDGTLEDRAGDVLHRLGALVSRQDVARQVEREQDRDDARDRDKPLERVGHQDLQGLLPGFGTTVRCVQPRRGGGRQGPDGRGSATVTARGLSPTGVRNTGEPPRRQRECMRASAHGSNRFAAPAHADARPAIGYAFGAGHRRDPPGGGSRDPIHSPLVDRRSNLGCLIEVVETLVLTLVIFFVIQNFVAQPYQVQQQSMERTLEPRAVRPRGQAHARAGTRTTGATSSCSTRPSPGRPTRRRSSSGSSASPATTVEVRDDGLVYVNGVRLDEPYTYANDAGINEPTDARATRPRWVVPEGELFVMGDHRRSRRTRGCSARSASPTSSAARSCATGRSTPSASSRRPSTRTSRARLTGRAADP